MPIDVHIVSVIVPRVCLLNVERMLEIHNGIICREMVEGSGGTDNVRKTKKQKQNFSSM